MYSIKKEKSQIMASIQAKCQSIGLSIDKKGYLDAPEKNLVLPFSNFGEICEEFGKGQGSELVAKDENRPKFCAVHSSSCLCVNSFALLKQYSSQLEFLGYRDFTSVQFEKKVRTGISTPNLDLYLENQDTIIGVESKFTELLTGKISNYCKNGEAVGNLEKYIHRKAELLALPEGFFEDILTHYAQAKEKSFLDVAQLIKHTLGLLAQSKMEHNKKPVLFYIYWTPTNAEKFGIYTHHAEEVKAFESRIGKYIEFHHASYLNIWDTYARNPLYKDCVAALQARYSFTVPWPAVTK